MHLEILDEPRIRLLKALIALPGTEAFYLAGGTALSLQLGLRKSFDFNFFTEAPFNAAALLARLRALRPGAQVIHVDRDTCDVSIDDVQVSFLRYPYPLIADLVTDEAAMPGLRLCGPEDIAAMKLSAIGSRGSRKDFYDLYQIYHRVPRFDSEKLMRCAHMKFGQDFDLTYMIAGLSFFDDAEDEVLPETFAPVDWAAVKRFFRQEQSVLFEMEAQRY